MKNYYLTVGVFLLITGYATEVLAYTCPKGFVPTINQAGKQSGCRKA
jgi:hypothetical protein